MPGFSRPRLCIRSLALLAVTLGLSGWSSPPHAVGKTADEPASATAQEKKPKAKKAKPPKLMASGGSGETKAERSSRLKRECRGQVNAGACSGYTE